MAWMVRGSGISDRVHSVRGLLSTYHCDREGIIQLSCNDADDCRCQQQKNEWIVELRMGEKERREGGSEGNGMKGRKGGREGERKGGNK